MGMHKGWESTFSLHSHLPRMQLTEEWELYRYPSSACQEQCGNEQTGAGIANPCLGMLWSGILTAQTLENSLNMTIWGKRSQNWDC